MPDTNERGAAGDLATRTLAEIYAQQGLFARAIEIYERIVRRSPDDAEAGLRLEALREAAGGGPAPADAPLEIAAVEVGPPETAADRVVDASRPPVDAPPEPAHRDEEFDAWLAGR